MSRSTPNIAADGAVHVAVGVITDGARVLVSQRGVGSHQAGKWEFPGGKLRADESPREALTRELEEELGVQVRAAYPLIQIRHSYPDKQVLLDVWRVTDYGGVPHGRESQVIDWVNQDRLRKLDLPAANEAIVAAACLPALYVISDAHRLGPSVFLRKLERGLKAGVRLVQLREPHLSAQAYCNLAQQVGDLCRRHLAELLLNATPEMVMDCNADGIHLNSQRLRALTTRPLTENHWVGASVHDTEELEIASRLGVDFVALAPVLATGSHPRATPLGWQNFKELCATVNTPVYALGGMHAEHLLVARDAGAQGLAMISGVWDAGDMEAVVRAIEGAN
ncbi:MAG: Nudix family hydrolase [Gammaproteobacteria bacterium]|nr:Nudix family hydrolase [Gammaproteobacteria bacterium]